MNRAGLPEAGWFELRSHAGIVEHGVVVRFGLGGRDVADGLEQPPVIEPVDPFERGLFDGLEAAPRSATTDHLGLVKALIVSAMLRQLRVAKVSTPVLILSGVSEMDSKVRSFGFGADDYVTKPFHREELIARIHAVVRRSKGHSVSCHRCGAGRSACDAENVENA